MTAFWYAVASLVITVISTVYNYTQQKAANKKLKKAQEDAKESARGAMIAVEGEIINLPLAYGRTKVAGARVFHTVASGFTGAAGRVSGSWVFWSGGSIVGVMAPSVTVSSAKIGLYKVMIPNPEPVWASPDIASYIGDWIQDKNPDNSLKYSKDPAPGDPYDSVYYGAYWLKPAKYDDAFTYTSSISSVEMTYDSSFFIQLEPGKANIFLVGANITLTHKPWFASIDGVVSEELGEFAYTITAYNAITGATTLSGYDLLSSLNPSSGYETTLPSTHDTSQFKDKNQALWWQQAICVGGISKILHIELDDEDYRLGKWDFRTHVRLNGGLDPWFSSNFPQLPENKFPDTCYATAMIWCNRDEPQLGAVPSMSFSVEGMKVHSIQADFTLSTTKAYSNNPALCLLDYLINTVYGKGLSLSEIDLESFYLVARTCDRLVPVAGEYLAPANGPLWLSKAAAGEPHLVKLYECNITLDTKKPVRENIELLVNTMEEADLIWSDGKYRLVLNYPEVYSATFDNHTIGRLDGTKAVRGASYYGVGEVVQFVDVEGNYDLYRSTAANNTLPPRTVGMVLNAGWEVGPANGVVCAYITDDDIAAEEEITQTWPTTQDRFNYCTVRFFNEAKGFKEDTVSWPNKNPIAVTNGTGINTYTQVVGQPSGIIGDFLNSKGIWNAGNPMTWEMYARETGVHTIEFLADTGCNLVVNGTTIYGHSATVTGATVNLNKGVVYTVSIGGGSYAAAIIKGPSGGIAWDTRYVSYNTLTVDFTDTTVYDTYLAQDNGVFLETEVFQSGDSSTYHATATAEAKVRLSRDATEYSFSVTRGFFDLEPGDCIRLNSDYLQIPGELMRVKETKVTGKGNIKLICIKFDAKNLAWNTKDSEVVVSRNVYDRSKFYAKDIVFTPSASFEDFAGVLSWTAASTINVDKYLVYLTTEPLGSITNLTNWAKVGETTDTNFTLPMLYRKTYVVTVRSVVGGVVSPIRDPLTGAGSPLLSFTINNTTVLPTPHDTKIYCTADALGNVTKIKATVTFGEVEPVQVDGLVVMLSQFPTPNACTIAGGGLTNKLQIGGAEVLATGQATILAGSTSDKLVLRSIGDPFDVTYNECSRWWVSIPGSEWRKVTSLDETSVMFAKGFSDSNDNPVSPTIGGICDYAELAWFDERQGEYRLSWLTNGANNEAIRWTGVEQDIIGGPFFITCERGAEGTTPVNANGGTLMYFPAPGAGTQNIVFPAAAFTYDNGIFSATCEVNVSISAGYSISASAAIATQLPDGSIIRSTIVPCVYGGPL